MGSLVQDGKVIFDRPDFSTQDYQLSKYVLTKLGNIGPKGRVYDGLIQNFLKQTDFFHLQFASACNSLDEYFEDNNFLGIVWANCYFENSIVAINLAQKFLECVYSNCNIPEDLRNSLPHDLEVYTEINRDRVRKARNHLQHMNERILKEYPEDFHYSLTIQSDRIVIGTFNFTYVELFDWLIELNKVGDNINKYYEGTYHRVEKGVWVKNKNIDTTKEE